MVFPRRFLYTPLGIKVGLKPFRNKKAPANEILEKAFKSNRSRFTEKQVTDRLQSINRRIHLAESG